MRLYSEQVATIASLSVLPALRWFGVAPVYLVCSPWLSQLGSPPLALRPTADTVTALARTNPKKNVTDAGLSAWHDIGTGLTEPLLARILTTLFAVGHAPVPSRSQVFRYAFPIRRRHALNLQSPSRSPRTTQVGLSSIKSDLTPIRNPTLPLKRDQKQGERSRGSHWTTTKMSAPSVSSALADAPLCRQRRAEGFAAGEGFAEDRGRPGTGALRDGLFHTPN
jgi:hypothetical protein